MTEVLKGRAGAVAHIGPELGRQRERARERLAAVGEGRAHERAQRGRRRRAGAVQSTLGTGWNTLRAIERCTRTSQASCARTLGTP